MKKARDLYLHDVPLADAWARFVGALQAAGKWSPLPGEWVSVPEAAGRVTAQPIWARLSAPHYHASAMDGYAVRAADTAGATETRPVVLRLTGAGQAEEARERCAFPVNTGHPLPLWADAVIMVEHTQLLDGEGMPVLGGSTAGKAIEIRAAVAPWEHVRPMGEDMVATELVLPANHTLRPVDLGAIVGSGHTQVLVRERPRVAIIPTGTELVSVTDARSLKPGEIIEFNSIVLGAQITQWGGAATRWQPVPDEFAAIRSAVLEAAQDHHLVLVNAGSSAGTEDYTASVVADVGQLLVHGIAVRPGHPVILGTVRRARSTGGEGSQPPTDEIPIIGVPGYPVSAALTGEMLVQPLLDRWQGRPPAGLPEIEAVMTRQVHSSVGDDEFLRVSVGKVGDRVVATPLSRGAGTISTLVRADGTVTIPRFVEGLAAGERVRVRLYRAPHTIENTIVAIGSHDLTLDLLAQHVAERAPGSRLSSAHVGSLGGLVALSRGEAHLAGSHLLDPDSGEYNLSYVRRYLPNQEVRLVTLVERDQGFLVPPGNPQGIWGWDDLRREEIRFVNRQRGAGTRLLLDYELGRRGISPESVTGYRRQEFTHLAVAAAVAAGAADFGLGIRAAASALGLDFVQLALEQYDLVIPLQHFDSHLLQPLLELLSDERFRTAVRGMPGYNVSRMGRVTLV